MLKITKLLLSITLFLSITACGFKMRGNYDIDAELKTLNLKAEQQYSVFTKGLVDILDKNNVTIVTNNNSDMINLNLSQPTINQSVIAQNAKGQNTKVKLTLEFNYSVTKKDQIIKNNSLITSHLEYAINPQAPLSNDSEKEIHIKTLYQRAYSLLLYQLSKIKITNDETRAAK